MRNPLPSRETLIWLLRLACEFAAGFFLITALTSIWQPLGMVAVAVAFAYLATALRPDDSKK